MLSSKGGASITETNNEGFTALLLAAGAGKLEVVQYLLSTEGGANITETNNEGNTALLLVAGAPEFSGRNSTSCRSSRVQWLLEFGGAQITDTNNAGDTVWTVNRRDGLPAMLRDDEGGFGVNVAA